MLCPQVNIRGLLVAFLLSQSVRAHLWYSCNLNTSWNSYLKHFLFSSWSCSLLLVLAVAQSYSCHYYKIYSRPESLLLAFYFYGSPGVSEKFTTSTMVQWLVHVFCELLDLVINSLVSYQALLGYSFSKQCQKYRFFGGSVIFMQVGRQFHSVRLLFKKQNIFGC